VLSILGHIGGLAVLWVLFRAGPLVSVTAAEAESQRALELANTINGVFGPALGIVGLFWAIGTGSDKRSESRASSAELTTLPWIPIGSGGRERCAQNHAATAMATIARCSRMDSDQDAHTPPLRGLGLFTAAAGPREAVRRRNPAV
jgi:hypothetical protein